MSRVSFETSQAFRSWLQRHHASATELTVVLRKGARAGLSWAEAVDQALCFGWIDGVRRRIDDERYAIRFAPRKEGSIWSARNIRRVAELEARGLLAPAGRRAFARRSQRKSRVYSYEREAPPELGAALEKTLRADRKAWAFFQDQAPSYRRKLVHWIVSAKSEDTRRRRLLRAKTAFAAGRRL